MPTFRDQKNERRQVFRKTWDTRIFLFLPNYCSVRKTLTISIFNKAHLITSPQPWTQSIPIITLHSVIARFRYETYFVVSPRKQRKPPIVQRFLRSFKNFYKKAVKDRRSHHMNVTITRFPFRALLTGLKAPQTSSARGIWIQNWFFSTFCIITFCEKSHEFWIKRRRGEIDHESMKSRKHNGVGSIEGTTWHGRWRNLQ